MTSPMPKSLRIGPYTWDIRCSKKAWNSLEPHIRDGADGATLPATHTIRIRPGLSPTYERIVLLHEVLHACRDSAHLMKLDLNDAEESFINAVAPILFGVFQDNPDFNDYLGIAS